MNAIFNMKQILISLVLLGFAAPVLAVPNGDLLYQDMCEACHGKNGQGGVGVPLSLPDFQRDASDEFLIKSIRNGRPGRVMPAFPYLSDAQLAALIKTIRGFVSEPAKPVKVPKAIQGDLKRGAKLYQQHCAACHGARGEGGKGTGVTFSRPRDAAIIATSLSNAAFQDASTDQMLWQALAYGRKGTPMPSYLEQGLSEQQISDMVAFVRTLKKKHAKPEAGEAMAPFIVSEAEGSINDVLESVKEAVIAANFKLIRVQKFEQGMVKEGSESPDKVIVYFCNFALLNKALALDPRIGLFLPCRLTLVKEGDKVSVFAMNPEAISESFNNEELDRICQQMRATYEAILEEVTL